MLFFSSDLFALLRHFLVIESGVRRTDVVIFCQDTRQELNACMQDEKKEYRSVYFGRTGGFFFRHAREFMGTLQTAKVSRCLWRTAELSSVRHLGRSLATNELHYWFPVCLVSYPSWLSWQ